MVGVADNVGMAVIAGVGAWSLPTDVESSSELVTKSLLTASEQLASASNKACVRCCSFQNSMQSRFSPIIEFVNKLRLLALGNVVFKDILVASMTVAAVSVFEFLSKRLDEEILIIAYAPMGIGR